jgi:hypothetical protein
MKKQHTPNTSTDLAYNVAGIAFLILTIALGALFIKDSMETNKRLAETWEVLEERKEAREALNANH